MQISVLCLDLCEDLSRISAISLGQTANVTEGKTIVPSAAIRSARAVVDVTARQCGRLLGRSVERDTVSVRMFS